ncbi:hypothetical protein [Alkalicoccus daliensis]|nr:hypothetical protein [Alkalicoccus daliensis]
METLILDSETAAASPAPTYLPIDNPSAVHLVNQTLEENDNDYLDGAIQLAYNGEVILNEELNTSDVLYTWQTLVEPILKPGDKECSIILLDSVCDVKLHSNSLGFTVSIDSGFDEYNGVSNIIYYTSRGVRQCNNRRISSIWRFYHPPPIFIYRGEFLSIFYERLSSFKI